ncbi:MAG: sulfotransferase [Caldilineaceae bacterium]
MSIKVIGAGFGRTGTKSLQVALEELGYAPCYHMTTLFEHPEQSSTWQAASAGNPVDWQTFLADYAATVDWPGCTFYQELMRAFPDAKVLLNVREPEKWYESAAATIYGATQGLPVIVRVIRPALANVVDMINGLIWQKTFDNRFADHAHAIAVFNAHNAEVQRVVPPERLLVYTVKEGWEPLCRFLDVPVPDKPFPHLNDTAEFQLMMKRRRWLAQLLPWALGLMAAGVAIALYWWLN